MDQRRTRKPARAAPLGLTPQQILILILVAVLGIAALALAAFVLFSLPPPTSSAAASQNSPGGAAVLPPTWTPAQAENTPSPAQPAATQPGAKQIPPLPAGCAQAGSEASQGTVTRVIDGGTIEVQTAGGTVRVGYAGIDVPEGNPLLDPLVQQTAQQMLENQPVVLVKDVSEQDSAGRLLRYVFAGGKFINYELVRQGLAYVLSGAADQACAGFLLQAEEQARGEHLGIWKPTAVPTRTFMPFVTLAPADTSGCDCSKKYVCSDFRTHAQAQSCFNLCNDYSSKLDEDHDGLACEELP